MKTLPELFENNRAWARARSMEDPEFFRRLEGGQSPPYLWIGCADSRVPANEIVGLPPGQLFVHRNIANVVADDDANCTSVLEYAVHNLGVEHIIVCGHYGCGGVLAALGPETTDRLERWLRHVRKVREDQSGVLAGLSGEARWRRFCELNVRAQVENLRRSPVVGEAWQAGRSLFLHGWIYSLHDGLLTDLELTAADSPDAEST